MGDETINVPENSVMDYKFKIIPKHAGQYLGYISFTEMSQEEKKQYYWFTIELNVARPPPIKIIELKTAIREPVQFIIELGNPLKNMTAYFDVQINGEGL